MTTAPRIAAALAALALALPARADDVCSPEDRREGRAAYDRARAADKAGRVEAAYRDARVAAGICGHDQKGSEEMVHRLGRVLGERAEKAGKLDEAFDRFSESGHAADADRVMMKKVDARPADHALFQNALGYFKNRGAEPYLARMRDIASRHVAAALADEEKAFAARQESIEELQRARGWLGHVDPEYAKTRARAVQRGDALAREEGRRHLQTAIEYYRFAGEAKKEKAVRDRARAQGEAALARGEGKLAADWFDVAGDGVRAGEVAKAAEAQQEKAEKKRQKKFKKETDALEKELGL